MHQKCSIAYLLTYLALSTKYMFYNILFFCFFLVCLFSYTGLFELKLFIVSEFGFRVLNHPTALATMEYLPILLLVNTLYLWFLRKYSGIYFAPTFLPFSLREPYDN